MFVRDGLIAQGVVDAVGAQGAASIRGPNSILGLEALRAKPAQAEAVALTAVKGCVIEPQALTEWLGPAGPARTMAEMLLDELERLHDEEAWRGGDCLARVARFALAQADSGLHGAMPLAKSTVARVLGMRPETLSRCLAELSARGLISRSPPHEVLDVSGLNRVAHLEIEHPNGVAR